MATWLGISILVAFSLGLNWFMRGQRSAKPPLPIDLGQWLRESGEDPSSGTFWERRTLFNPGSLLVRPHLIEQRRRRRAADGEILEVVPERRLD